MHTNSEDFWYSFTKEELRQHSNPEEEKKIGKDRAKIISIMQTAAQMLNV
jgi:hypothetical protein